MIVKVKLQCPDMRFKECQVHISGKATLQTLLDKLTEANGRIYKHSEGTMYIVNGRLAGLNIDLHNDDEVWIVRPLIGG